MGARIAEEAQDDTRQTGRLMMKNRGELALLETLDMGKPISDSSGGDIPGVGRYDPMVRRDARQGL